MHYDYIFRLINGAVFNQKNHGNHMHHCSKNEECETEMMNYDYTYRLFNGAIPNHKDHGNHIHHSSKTEKCDINKRL